MKLCTKNYENLSIFVKVTAKKISGICLCGHGVGGDENCSGEEDVRRGNV